MAALDWLDRYWAGETPEGSLVFHNSDQGARVERITAAIHHRGVPVLLMFADAPHVRRFDVFVASHDRHRKERPHAALEPPGEQSCPVWSPDQVFAAAEMLLHTLRTE